MKCIGLSLLALLLCSCSRGNEKLSREIRSHSKEVTFPASDGGAVFGDLYESAVPATAVVLMFHQANSNSIEYAPIAPRVTKMGFDCLAIDQRSGGAMFDGVNRTAKAAKGPTGYMDAYLDMLGALRWAENRKYERIILWGSSYSAGLVLRMAAEHPTIAAVLAFSPGEYYGHAGTAASWATRDHSPTLMAFTEGEKKDVGETLFRALPATKGNVLVSYPDGVHGSSTLREDRNPKGYGRYWNDVEAFLNAIKG